MSGTHICVTRRNVPAPAPALYSVRHNKSPPISRMRGFTGASKRCPRGLSRNDFWPIGTPGPKQVCAEKCFSADAGIALGVTDEPALPLTVLFARPAEHQAHQQCDKISQATHGCCVFVALIDKWRIGRSPTILDELGAAGHHRPQCGIIGGEAHTCVYLGGADVRFAEGSGTQSGAVAAVALEAQCGDISGRISFVTGGKSFRCRERILSAA
jgi:hypothetical protein